MKKYWLYVVALLLPIFTLAQSLPTYTLIGENTVCGGNIKVDWSAAVAASIPVTQWKAELYDSNSNTKSLTLKFDKDTEEKLFYLLL